MTEVPLEAAHPGLIASLQNGEHVTAVVAFLLIEDASDTSSQQVQVTATHGLGPAALRGLVELGRDAVREQQGAA